jgi:hypothetical protein
VLHAFGNSVGGQAASHMPSRSASALVPIARCPWTSLEVSFRSWFTIVDEVVGYCSVDVESTARPPGTGGKP